MKRRLRVFCVSGAAAAGDAHEVNRGPGESRVVGVLDCVATEEKIQSDTKSPQILQE